MIATMNDLSNNIFFITKKYELACVKDIRNTNTVYIRFKMKVTKTTFTELVSIVKIIDCKPKYQQKIINTLIKKYA